MRLFGKSKKKAVEAPKDSIVQMRATLDMLEKKEKHLDTKILQEMQTARQNAVSNKSMAMMALKRKKMYESQKQHTQGARFNLETQILAIENANVNLETLNAMKSGSKVMESIHGEVDIDKVEDIMDNVREQMDLASEISAAISNPLGMDLGMDEDELEAELEQIEQAELDATLLDVKAGPVMEKGGMVPAQASLQSLQAQSKSTAADEEAELEDLRQSMAL